MSKHSKVTTLKSSGRKTWKMDQKTYDTIKTLTKLNLSDTKIAEITNWSSNSVYRVRSSEDLQGYFDYMKNLPSRIQRDAERADAKGKATVEPKSESAVTEQELREAEPVLVPTDSTKEMTLERIAVALERLATAWESQPTKKTGLFG